MNDEELSDLRYRIRHSAAHVMADVVTTMYPDAKLAIGPPTEDGFYYDFLVENPFSDEDLKRIERQMKKIGLGVIGINPTNMGSTTSLLAGVPTLNYELRAVCA